MGNVEFNVGVAWYRPEQWARLLEVSSDRADLEDTHEEWVSGAKQTLRNLLLEGINAVRVDVDVEELVEWSKQRGLNIDGSARAAYVADKVRKEKFYG